MIGHTSGRVVFEIFRTFADRTVTLPPSIASTAVITLTAPCTRLQAVAPWSASSFNSAVSIAYTSQTPLRLASVNIAPGLLSSTLVTIAMPDFTGVTGFDLTWLPATTATGTWSVQMAGSTQSGATSCQEGLRSWSASALGTF